MAKACGLDIEVLKEILANVKTKGELELKAGDVLRFNTDSLTLEEVHKLLGLDSTLNVANKEALITGLIESSLTNYEKSFIINRIKNVVNVDAGNSIFANSDLSIDEQLNSIHALHEVVGDIASQTNIINNNNFKTNEAKELIDPITGIPNIPMDKVASSLGRKIALSHNYKINITKDMTADNVESIYMSIGESALNNLSKTGIISITDGKYSSNRAVSKEGDFIEKTVSGRVIQIKPIEGTVPLRHIKALKGILSSNVSEKEKNVYLKSTLANSVDMAKFNNRLTIPSVVQITNTNYADANVRTKDDLVVEDKFNSMLRTFQETGFSINTTFLPVLLEMKEIMDNGRNVGMTSDQIMDSIGSNELVHKLFGKSNIDKIAQGNQESSKGKTISKTYPLLDFLSLFDEYIDKDTNEPKEVFGNYKFTKNSRLHTIQSVLNYQTDNFFSRHIVTTGPATIQIGSKGDKHFKEALVDETGKDLSFLMNDKDVTKQLDYMERMSQLDFMKMLITDTSLSSKNKENTMLWKSKSIWSYMNELKAVSDLRNQSNGEYTTEYMTKPDAVTSGITLMMMQQIGKYGPNVESLFKRLGLIDAEYDVNELDDIYHVLGSKMQGLAKNEFNQQFEGGEGQLAKLIESDILGVRDLSKSPTMTAGAYAQHRNSAVGNISKKIVNGIYDLPIFDRSTKKSNDLVLDFDDSVRQDISKEDIKKIEYVAKALSNALGQTLSKTSNTDTRKVIEEILQGIKDNYSKEPEVLRDYLVDKVMNYSDGIDVKRSLLQYYGSNKGVANYMFDSIQKELVVPYIAQYKNDLKTVYDQIIKTGSKDIKILTPHVYMNKDSIMENENITEAQLLDKYGMSLSKSKEVMYDIDNAAYKGKATTKQDMHNEPSLYVIVQHAIDNAVMTYAAARTADKVGHTTMGMPIHDAIANDANTNAEYTDSYEIEQVRISKEYDAMDSLLLTLKIENEKRSNDADIEQFYNEKKLANDEAIVRKKEALDKIKVGERKLFGYDKLEDYDGKPTKPSTPKDGKKDNDSTTVDRTESTKSSSSSSDKEPKEEKNETDKGKEEKTTKEHEKTEDKETTKEVNDNNKEDDFRTPFDIDFDPDNVKVPVSPKPTKKRTGESTLLDDVDKEAYEARDVTDITAPITKFVDFSNTYLKDLLQYHTTKDNGILDKLSTANDILSSKFEFYSDIANRVSGAYDKYPVLQAFLHSSNWDNFKYAEAKGELHNVFSKASRNRDKVISDITKDLSESLDKLSTEDRNKMEDFMGKYSGFARFHEQFKKSKFLNKTNIELLEEYLNNNKVNGDLQQLLNEVEIKGIESTIGAELGSIYDKAYGDVKDIDKVLVDKIITYSQVKDEMIRKTFKDSTHRRNNSVDLLKPNRLMDKHYTYKVMTLKDWQRESMEQQGYKVLREPTENDLGVFYKKAEEGLSTHGLIDTPNMLDGIELSSELASASNGNDNILFSTNGSTPLLKLTNEEKSSISNTENVLDSFATSIGNSIFIDDTEAIRNHLTSKAMTGTINSTSTEDSSRIIKQINTGEHPWFLELKGGTVFDKLPEEIKNKYQKIDSSFDELYGMGNVRYVRNDIKHWVVGEKQINITANSSEGYKKALEGYKKAVQLFKMRLVTQNPIKLLMDLISSYNYLLNANVPVMKILKYSQESMKGIGEIQKMYDLDMIDRLNGKEGSRVKNHKFGFLYERGMIQSLSSEIIADSKENASGLQASINDIIDMVGKTDSGNKTKFMKLMDKATVLNIPAEVMLDKFGQLSKKLGAEQLGQGLNKLSDDLNKINTEKDGKAFINQIIGGPDSVITKAGAGLMVVGDAIPRATYYMHLIDKGMSPSEAEIEVHKSFIDYRVPQTKEMKLISDLGIIMFPMFLMRVQRTIFNLTMKKPVTVMAVAAFEALTGFDINNLQEENLINRDMKDTVLSDPSSAFSLGNTYPSFLGG